MTLSSTETVVVHVIKKAGGAPAKTGIEQREESAAQIFRIAPATHGRKSFAPTVGISPLSGGNVDE